MNLVPERPISANPGLKFCSVLVFFLPMYCLDYHFCVISFSYVRLKAQKHFVSSSCMFLGKKTLLKITLNPGLNLTAFRRTGPRLTDGKRSVTKNHSTVIESPWLFHWLDVKKYSIIAVPLRI